MVKADLFASGSAFVAQYDPNRNFGSPPDLYFGQYLNSNDGYRTLLRFPIHPHFTCHPISLATLELTISRNEIPPELVINAGLQKALQPWKQFSVTWNTQPLYAPIRTFTITANTPVRSVISLDVTTTVRDWLNGVIPNHGFVITGNESINSIVGINNVPLPVHLRPPLANWDIPVDPFGVQFTDVFDEVELQRRYGEDRTELYVQDPVGSLNFVERLNFVNRVGRPRLVIKYIQ